MDEDLIEQLRTRHIKLGYELPTESLFSAAAEEIERLNTDNARLREALQLGMKMRAAQRAYFSDRNRSNLIASKQAEEEFDANVRAALAEKEPT